MSAAFMTEAGGGFGLDIVCELDDNGWPKPNRAYRHREAQRPLPRQRDCL